MPLLNDFGFGVVGEQEKNGYVDLDSGTKYQLKLWNFNTKLRCDAEVKIDGKTVGNFRIEKMDSIIIERPANDHGCFTFYAVGTIEAKIAMLEAVEENSLGLIEVTFYPEKKPTLKNSCTLQQEDDLASLRYQINPEDDELEALQKKIDSDYVPGGTGLSGYSSIDYETTESLNYDYDNIVTIYLRLVSTQQKLLSLQKSTFPNSITAPTENKPDTDLTAWIADQQAKLIREQAILKASIDKSKSFTINEELMTLLVEQEKTMEKYRQKISFLETEESKEELVDYWEVN